MSQELPRLYWHTIALIGGLAVWGVWALGRATHMLATAPAIIGFDLADYYFHLSVPVLILVVAYLLFRRSKQVIYPLLALSVLYVLLAVRMYPEPLSAGDFLAFPWSYRLGLCALIGCIMYCLFLRKRKKLV